MLNDHIYLVGSIFHFLQISKIFGWFMLRYDIFIQIEINAAKFVSHVGDIGRTGGMQL